LKKEVETQKIYLILIQDDDLARLDMQRTENLPGWVIAFVIFSLVMIGQWIYYGIPSLFRRVL